MAVAECELEAALTVYLAMRAASVPQRDHKSVKHRCELVEELAAF